MKGYVKISTYIITIVVLLIIFSVSTFFVISHYKKEQIKVNIPTLVEENTSSDSLSNLLVPVE